jgi:hypothetical protein
MIRVLLCVLLFTFLLPACAPQKPRGSTVVVKPKTHKHFFVKGKDRYKKKTKLVRMKN